MPQIAELKEIDGALWARIPLSGEQGHVQLLSETEIAENGRKLDKLLAENERLRAALKPFAEVGERFVSAVNSGAIPPGASMSRLKTDPLIASDLVKAALAYEQKAREVK